jgi:hypothetical protein|tara:strand:+ start:244 stop:513 length:270 start_codon:yes stop_codon:yes gene_type:complete
MKKVVLKKVLEIEEFGNKFYDLFEELYELGEGLDIYNRYVEIGFWKNYINNFIEDIKDDGEWDDHENKDMLISLLSEVNKYDDDVLLKF